MLTRWLLRWYSGGGLYGLVRDALIVTDQGSHFANSLLDCLSRHLKFRQHFSVVYSPWANGTAEVTNVAVLRLFRSLLSEAWLPLASWPNLVSSVMLYLNQMARKSLTLDEGMCSSNAVFLGYLDEPDDLTPLTWRKDNGHWSCTRLDTPALRAQFLDVTHRLESVGEIADLREHIVRNRR